LKGVWGKWDGVVKSSVVKSALGQSVFIALVVPWDML